MNRLSIGMSSLTVLRLLLCLIRHRLFVHCYTVWLLVWMLNSLKLVFPVMLLFRIYLNWRLLNFVQLILLVLMIYNKLYKIMSVTKKELTQLGQLSIVFPKMTIKQYLKLRNEIEAYEAVQLSKGERSDKADPAKG